VGRRRTSPGLLYEGSVVQSHFGVKCGVTVGEGAKLGIGTGAAGASSGGGQGGGGVEQVLVVVTTDGRDTQVLVRKHGHGVHLEEVGELSEAGRSRNAHRVAVRRGGMEIMEEK